MILYSGPLSMFGAKAEVAMAEKGAPCRREFVPFSLATLYEPLHPEVARINPKGQVPVLVDGDLELYDSTQVFEFLEDAFPEPALWPRDPRERARARLTELESDEVFFPNVITLMPRGRSLAGEEGVAKAVAAIAEFHARMDARLEGREYLAGDFGYPDIAFFLAQFFGAFLGCPVPDSLARLRAWKRRVASRDSVRGVAGAMVEYLGRHGLVASLD